MDEVHNKFGLRHKKSGKIITYRTESNSGEGVSEQHILDDYSEELWFVDTAENAEWVRLNSTPWYNAGHDTPTHYYQTDELEVINIDVIVKTEPVDVKIPTPYEFFEAKYAKKNPKHWERLKKTFEDPNAKDFDYGLYDLQEFLRKTPE